MAASFDDVQRNPELSMALLLIGPRHVAVPKKHFIRFLLVEIIPDGTGCAKELITR